MITYTTCAGCGEIMQVIDTTDHHPGCTPKRTRIEQLAAKWLQAAKNGDTTIADKLETEINQLQHRPPRLGAAAIQYAKWGWPVFPLIAGTKRPATRNGFKDATLDIDRIQAWWQRNPDSNIGLPTGHRFDVIDIDVPDGIPSMIQLINNNKLIVHGHVTTSSGGTHLYVKPTGRGNTARSMPGVDYRGIGGYVVAPPSTLGPPGRAWSWTHKPSPEITRQDTTE